MSQGGFEQVNCKACASGFTVAHEAAWYLCPECGHSHERNGSAHAAEPAAPGMFASSDGIAAQHERTLPLGAPPEFTPAPPLSAPIAPTPTPTPPGSADDPTNTTGTALARVKLRKASLAATDPGMGAPAIPATPTPPPTPAGPPPVANQFTVFVPDTPIADEAAANPHAQRKSDPRHSPKLAPITKREMPRGNAPRVAAKQGIPRKRMMLIGGAVLLAMAVGGALLAL